jgi:phosphoadenosine phosphosulfate reductase
MNKNLYNKTMAEVSIERLKMFEPPEGYYVAFSGGKDSCVIKQLCIDAGVKFDAHYGQTTIDPPELVYFIKQYHKDVIWEKPKKPYLVRLIEKGFPLRQSRWCCKEYKEQGGSGRSVVTGIRAAESAKRAKRNMVEVSHTDHTKKFLNVIIDWEDVDVWDYIHESKIPYCKLYDEGWKRLGCLFCPMATKGRKLWEVGQYPRFALAFIKAFQCLKDNRTAKGLHSCDEWANGTDMFNWYISGENSGEDEQCGLFT